MADGRLAHDWHVAAHLLAMTANVHRDPKKRPRPFEPGEFNLHALASRRRDADEDDGAEERAAFKERLARAGQLRELRS